MIPYFIFTVSKSVAKDIIPMPELPEVETTLRGIKPHIANHAITDVIIRHPSLRWPIPLDLKNKLQGEVIRKLKRRGKYLLFEFNSGTLILHLGMSGRLKIHTTFSPPQKHDHVDICFNNQIYLRLTDPRRFGALLWTTEPENHPLLVHLGKEPLLAECDGKYLWQNAQGRKLPVKSFIMDNKIIVGVGNIYATEALFNARIHPTTPAGKISLRQFEKLMLEIKVILKKAIQKGGTTLKDFAMPSGSSGYFQMELNIYGKSGEPCPRCYQRLKSILIGQRTTVFCAKCQSRI